MDVVHSSANDVVEHNDDHMWAQIHVARWC